MAIAHDADANSGTVANPATSPQAFNHTMGSVSNGIVVVGVSLWENVAGVGLVTGVTYGGNAMTRAGTEVVNGSMVSDLFYLVNPASGVNSVSISFTGSGGGILGLQAGAMSFSGVDGTSPADATNNASGFSQNATVNTTTIADNAWVAHNMVHFNVEAATIGQGTQAWNLNGGATLMTGTGGWVGPKTPAGSQTTNWTWATNNRDWAINTLSMLPFTSFNPGGSASTSKGTLPFMGAG
jgi:hypothetical protein